MHITRLDEIFHINMALAYEKKVGDVDLQLPVIQPKRRGRKRGFDGICDHCGCHFTARQRARFCPGKPCANRYHVAKNRERAKQNPAAAKNRQGDINRQWTEFRMADQMGMTDVPPPKLVGRPTRAQKEDIEEYRRLEEKRLAERKRNRLSQN